MAKDVKAPVPKYNLTYKCNPSWAKAIKNYTIAVFGNIHFQLKINCKSPLERGFKTHPMLGTKQCLSVLTTLTPPRRSFHRYCLIYTFLRCVDRYEYSLQN